jgi:hypothetical protein
MKLKKNAKVSEYSPTQELLDETFIAKAVLRFKSSAYSFAAFA